MTSAVRGSPSACAKVSAAAMRMRKRTGAFTGFCETGAGQQEDYEEKGGDSRQVSRADRRKAPGDCRKRLLSTFGGNAGGEREEEQCPGEHAGEFAGDGGDAED